jgi:hypothetical protein
MHLFTLKMTGAYLILLSCRNYRYSSKTKKIPKTEFSLKFFKQFIHLSLIIFYSYLFSLGSYKNPLKKYEISLTFFTSKNTKIPSNNTKIASRIFLPKYTKKPPPPKICLRGSFVGFSMYFCDYFCINCGIFVLFKDFFVFLAG